MLLLKVSSRQFIPRSQQRVSEYKHLESSYVQFSEKRKDIIRYQTLVQISAPSNVAIMLGHTPSLGKFHNQLISERKIRCYNKLCKV